MVCVQPLDALEQVRTRIIKGFINYFWAPVTVRSGVERVRQDSDQPRMSPYVIENTGHSRS